MTLRELQDKVEEIDGRKPGVSVFLNSDGQITWRLYRTIDHDIEAPSAEVAIDMLVLARNGTPDTDVEVG